jgi:hypothetical protein
LSSATVAAERTDARQIVVQIAFSGRSTMGQRHTLVSMLALAALALPGLGMVASTRAQNGTPVASQPPTRVIAILTGPNSINETHTRYGVDGTDLGHTFLFGDQIVMVFGDTFGPARTDWRSNVAAVSTDEDPSDGISFDRMIEDLPGHAKELIDNDLVPGEEVTIIPTYGIAVGERMFLHYMAVRKWGTPGRWDLNQSGLAYSDDEGQTWTVDPNATWVADSNFGQVAIEAVGAYAYFFGIPGGRFGGVNLARVKLDQLREKSAYEYWDGTDWVLSDESVATTIVPAPVGELSVRWNSYYNTWVMMYLNEDKYSIVLRTADCLTGPWSDERVVATGADYPQLYAPFMLPKWNDGPDIYFTMSLFGPYHVQLMATSLGDAARTASDPSCVTPASPVATG